MPCCNRIVTLGAMIEYNDRECFADVVLPDGADKDILIDYIEDLSGELETFYPSPDKLKRATELFFKAYAYRMERLWLSTQQEYNPIENYDRKEDIKNTRSWAGDDVTKYEGKSDTDTMPGSVQEHQVSAYNSSQYQNKDKIVNSGTDLSETSVTSTSTLTRGTEEQEDITGRVHGNIGVTTSQQMLMSEREVANFSWYRAIALDYQKFTCVEVF